MKLNAHHKLAVQTPHYNFFKSLFPGKSLNYNIFADYISSQIFLLRVVANIFNLMKSDYQITLITTVPNINK